MASEPALTIRRKFPRPDPAIVDAFRTVPTGVVVDAMGRRGALDHRIRPLTEAHRFCGVALTVWTVPRDNLAPYAALKFARPGDVIVVATGGGDEASIFGDLALGMARNCGVAAVVTDGLVRDIEGLNRVGIPVFACGLSPNSPFKNGPGEIGGTITLGGVTVSAGDIVLGDRDGVVVVPRDRAESAIEGTKAVLAKESEIERAIAGGLKLPAWLDGALADEGAEYLD